VLVLINVLITIHMVISPPEPVINVTPPVKHVNVELMLVVLDVMPETS